MLTNEAHKQTTEQIRKEGRKEGRKGRKGRKRKERKEGRKGRKEGKKEGKKENKEKKQGRKQVHELMRLSVCMHADLGGLDCWHDVRFVCHKRWKLVCSLLLPAMAGSGEFLP